MIKEVESNPWHLELHGKVDDRILGYKDKQGFLWDKVNPEHLRYFKNKCFGYPFTNHLAVVLMVLSNQNLNPNSIDTNFRTVNVALRELFQELKLTSVNDFDANIYLSDYLRREILPSHSDYKRSNFFQQYNTVVGKVYKWYKTKLTKEQQEVFAPFLLPQTYLNGGDFKVTKSARETTKSKRKSETDAISKDFLKIKAEAGFRMNQVRRLRQKFYEVVELVEQGDLPLPYEFAYIDNGERVGMSQERFSFRLWDKPSFVLHHSEKYGAATIKNAQKRKATYSEENNEYFVEFLKAELLDDKSGEPIEETEGFWFLPILEHHLIGIWHQSLTEEEINGKLKIFEMYGYSEPDSIGLPHPFRTQKGILAQGTFITNSQQYADGVLLNVETLYITALFGMTALDIFTVSGARIGEVAQIHFGIGCLNQGDFTDPKTGKTKSSYMFRAIPKGRDEPAIFYVTKDTFNLIEEILIYLTDEHYNKDSIPTVKFNYRKESGTTRADQPYMFQLYNRHFDDIDFYHCSKFHLLRTHL